MQAQDPVSNKDLPYTWIPDNKRRVNTLSTPLCLSFNLSQTVSQRTILLWAVHKTIMVLDGYVNGHFKTLQYILNNYFSELSQTVCRVTNSCDILDDTELMFLWILVNE